MLTQVAQTSIESFYNPENAAARAAQRKRVVEFIISETKAGRPTSRTAIAAHFYKIGFEPLAQKSSVARAVNEIIKLGTVFHNGREYRFEQTARRKFRPEDRTEIEHFCLVLVQRDTKQGELF